jgi:uroporphyrinogen-III synthase
VRILVTRPQPGANRTAARLREMGFEPIVLPLSETTALAAPDNAIPANMAAVAVTSANALRHAPPHLIERLAGLPCHAVGKRTGEAARAAGFIDVEEGPGDALALADAIAGKYAGKMILYLCGRQRFSGFEQHLAAAGVQVRPVETYDTIAINYADEAVLSLLSGHPVDIVLLYSVKAAENMRGLAANSAFARYFEHARVLALSRRIGAAFGGPAHVAPMPDEDALLALLTGSN